MYYNVSQSSYIPLLHMWFCFSEAKKPTDAIGLFSTPSPYRMKKKMALKIGLAGPIEEDDMKF
jgi:hypothetical protein